jgi:phosphate starvation-inducible membrane PsiE
LLILAVKTAADTIFLAAVVLMLTVTLFLIGFRRGR